MDLAERETDTVMPGFTHLQSAQPVTFGHHMLAWYEMLARDVERFADARARINRLPLGSAALAGTGHPIDRELTARCSASRSCATTRSTRSPTATSASSSSRTARF